MEKILSKKYQYNQYLTLGKTYCPLPFKEIYADNDGNYKLCCHANMRQSFKVQDMLPFDWFFSEYMEEVRQKMMEGGYLHECKKCMLLEESDKVSHRHTAIRSHGVRSTVEDVRLKLRINGSACNLACYMCHPYNSSERRKEFKAIWGKETDTYFAKYDNNRDKIKFTLWDRPVKRNTWNDIVDNILANIHLISNIHMTGGEPLQLPRHWELVNKIPDEHAKNIKLTYDSNITQLNYKNQHILDLKSRFKRIFVGCSADHYGRKLEYIRYPIDYKQFEENLKFVIENFSYSLNITVALLNINEIDKIVEYYKDIGVKNIHYGIVTVPRILSIRNVSSKYKAIFNEKYSHKRYDLIRSELNKPIYSSNWYEVFCDYMDKLYAYRNLDWRSEFDVESYRS
tara:strand:+ start:313 stop:1506 length:1194 start_codon:yes stop_codon:yes gene_type:complete